MAKTNIKKNAKGYGYTYTDLAQIHNEMEEQGLSYYQYVDVVDGVDYIMTVIDDGSPEKIARRGCRIPEAKLSGKSNPAQEMGSAITYARRYSLLMALGWATTDDDAACMTVEQPQEHADELAAQIATLASAKGVTIVDICNRGHVKSLNDMPVQKMKNCIAWLEGM